MPPDRKNWPLRTPRAAAPARAAHAKPAGHAACVRPAMSKYDPLRAYLDSCGGVDVPLSFADIEAVLGFDLPYSARHHRHWWGNNAFGHAQSRSWMKARYKVAKIDLAAETVVFANYQRGPGEIMSGEKRGREVRGGPPSRGRAGSRSDSAAA